MEGLFLAGRFSGINIGSELVGGEGHRVPQMGIEHQEESGSFLDDPHPGMRMSMDPPLVSFGKTEEAFEFQVVPGSIEVFIADEESGAEAVHGLGHMLSDGIGVVGQGLLKGVEGFLALSGGAGGGSEGGGYLADRFDVGSEVLLPLLHGFEAAVEATAQSC